MKSGFRIEWTDHALTELAETFEYLERNWTEKEMQNLSNKIERTLSLISKNPELFQESKISIGVRRAVIMKYNSLYYRKNNEVIEILSFFFKSKKPKEIRLINTAYKQYITTIKHY